MQIYSVFPNKLLTGRIDNAVKNHRNSSLKNKKRRHGGDLKIASGSDDFDPMTTLSLAHRGRGMWVFGEAVGKFAGGNFGCNERGDCEGVCDVVVL